MLIFSLIFAMIVCFGVPIGGFLILRRRGTGRGKAFWIGVLAFTISQFVLRIPILTSVLPQYAWFFILQRNPWAYGFFLGLSAALFEEVARWIGMRVFLKGRTDWESGVAFGLGHGGIEAMVLTGINCVVLLVLILVGKGGEFPVQGASVLIGAAERLYAIAFHVSASVLVLEGIRFQRQWQYLLLAIVLHTILDAGIVILPQVFGVGILGLELYGTLITALTVLLSMLCYRRGVKNKER